MYSTAEMDLDFDLELESVAFRSNAINRDKKLKIHVFCGGKGQPQQAHFVAAIGECIALYSFDANIEYLYIDDLRNNHTYWSSSPSVLIDWLLDCDAHFILSQGIHMQLMLSFDWNAADIYSELTRIKYHPGIPIFIF
jgi:hypothetical protein